MAISLRLPEDLSIRLDKLAEKTGRTKAYYMIEAIRKQLADLEDLYLAEKRFGDIMSGKSKPITLAEVMRDHGLEDTV